MTNPDTTGGGDTPTRSPSPGAVTAKSSVEETTPKNSPSVRAQRTVDDLPSPTNGDSTTRSSSLSYAQTPSSLAKSDSVASAGQRSIASHVSVSAIGTIPLGGLHLHHPSDALDEEPPPPPPKCLENGDVFLILDLPLGFTVGIDTLTVTADSAKVSGFRDIPPGPHFLWVSAPNAISRCGYWFVTGPQGETRVKQWDRYNEVLGEAASHFEVRTQKENIDETYPRLIPHNYRGGRFDTSGPPPPPAKDLPRGIGPSGRTLADDGASPWQELTSAISPAFLNRITGRKNVREWLLDTSDAAKGEINFPESAKLLKAVAGSELDFLFRQDVVDLDLLRISSATAESLRDATPRILALLDGNGEKSATTSMATESDIVGELQFTFLTGLHLGNSSCLDQWWYLLLKVILRAYRLAAERPTLCLALLQTLLHQLAYSDRYVASSDHDERKQLPGAPMAASGNYDGGGILDTAPRNKTRLCTTLALYNRRLRERDSENDPKTFGTGGVGVTFSDLVSWFSRHGWDMRDGGVGAVTDGDEGEDGDYVPVVVELDEAGREVGLVRWD